MAAISVRDLTKAYDGRVVVDAVSFDVEEGEIFGILGPNGAGKTTTVECVAGLRRPDGGTIEVLGHDPDRDEAAVRRVMGVQLQESRIPGRLAVREALELYRTFYEDPADIEHLLDVLDLRGQQATWFSRLSGGQQQRLSIALALVGQPRVAILDELTTGLDPRARRDTWTLIERVRDEGVTIVLVTHVMEEAARLCDRVAVVDAGRVVALDTPDALVRESAREHRMAFVPSRDVDVAMLRVLPDVDEAATDGRLVTVTGGAGVVQAVVSHLAQHQVVAEELRVDQPSLDDAFVALTGRSFRDTREDEA